jgi:hypothetical protein
VDARRASRMSTGQYVGKPYFTAMIDYDGIAMSVNSSRDA